MKGLAEYVMLGRFRALLVVMAGAGSLMFCWISAAVIALVTLRKGPVSGAWLLLWALLPAGALLLLYGDGSPLALLIGAGVLALVLRSTVSLPLTLLASIGVGLVTAVGMLLFAGTMLEQIVAAFSEFLGGMEQQLSVEGAEPVVLARPTVLQVAGMMGMGNSMMSVLCLLLARYWQAALYNPGGFGVEFRALYLPRTTALGLLVVALVVWSSGIEYRSWAMMFLVPLTFCGLALIHAHATWRGRSSRWLIGFYLAWLLIDPLKFLVVVLAVIDSFKQFRRRWITPTGGDPGDDGGELN